MNERDRKELIRAAGWSVVAVFVLTGVSAVAWLGWAALVSLTSNFK